MIVYVINLPVIQRSGEINFGDKQKIYIESIVFPNKVEEDVSIDYGFHKEQYGFPLSNSEILNFMAHRIAWKQFLNTNEPWCIMLENNVSLNAELHEIYNAIQVLPEDWELFFPYDPFRIQEGMIQNNPAKFLVNPNSWEMNDWEPYFLGYKWGNSIYFINREGARRLLSIVTIRQRLDDEILTLAKAEEVSMYAGDINRFDYKQIEPVVFCDRNKLIWKAICEGSTWTSFREEKARRLLKVMSDAAEGLKIDILLEAGTLLGYIRHGGIMPWDDDIDLAIEENKLPIFLEQLKELDGIRYGQFSEFHTGTPYYKIWYEDDEVIENYQYKFPFVDLWLFNKNGGDLVFKNGFIYPTSASCDFVEIMFEGAKFKIPHNSIEILDTRFKDWKKKIRVYSWSHRFEKHQFIPLSLDIEVNADGRLVSLF